MNVIYIHTHDTGKIISPYGYKVPTINLEEFSKDATLFQNAFCVSPTCSPSRSSMLTGMYPHQVGMLGLSQRGFVIDDSKHLVKHFNKHNYTTALCGIQHESGWYLDHELGAKKLGYQVNLTNDNSTYRQEDLGEWDMLNAKSMANWISEYDDEKPFFASFGMYSTHRRYPDNIDSTIDVNNVNPPYPMVNNKQTREDFSKFMTSAKIADECFKEVIDALKKSNKYENTIILFTTDHGLANPFSKCNLFDSGTAVSLIMRVPDCNSNGKVVDNLVSHIDIYPTLCDLLKFEKPNWLQGKSFAKSFDDIDQATRSEIFTEINFQTSYEPIRSVRTSRYKYIRYYDEDYLKINLSNIDESVCKDFFLNNDLSKKEKYSEALYDLYYDIGERNNLFDNVEYFDIINELKKSLETEMIKSNDPLIHGEIKYNSQWKVNKKQCITASSKNSEDYEH